MLVVVVVFVRLLSKNFYQLQSKAAGYPIREYYSIFAAYFYSIHPTQNHLEKETPTKNWMATKKIEKKKRFFLNIYRWKV